MAELLEGLVMGNSFVCQA